MFFLLYIELSGMFSHNWKCFGRDPARPAAISAPEGGPVRPAHLAVQQKSHTLMPPIVTRDAPSGQMLRRRTVLAGALALPLAGVLPRLPAAAATQTAATQAGATQTGADLAATRAAALRAGIGSGVPLFVVAVGNDPADATQFETWVGRPVDGVQLHTGRESWEDWSGSIGWLIDVWSQQSRPIFWSLQIMPRGATLADGAAGAYDAHYAAAAQTLAAGQPEGRIFVRTGWEFNGDWMTWAATRGRARAFVATFRNLVAQFRAVSDRFVIEWCPNIGDMGMDPEDAWPGDDVVDIVGLDFYYQPQFSSHDPDKAWAEMVGRPYGLAWHRDFAAAHGKPRAFAEWGVTLDSSAPYVRQVAAWVREDDVVYQSYWNSDGDYPGKLSGDRIPDAGAAFRQMFGKP